MNTVPIYYWFVAAAAVAAAVMITAALLRKRRRGAAQPVTVEAGARLRIGGRLSSILGRSSVDEAFWSDLESALIEADVGPDVTQRLLKSARNEKSCDCLKQVLADEMIRMLGRTSDAANVSPHVVVVVGVNGVGKTTTIAKLAHRYQREGKKVLLVAADTFRAAAVEQLKEWGRRLGCEVVAQGTGADAAAVAFDGVSKAKAKGFDVVIIDTAGRLHTKGNLMDELGKVMRVIGRAMPGAPHEKILVIDATVGSNGLVQARQFNDAVGLTSVVVTKLDGTAKGGVLLAVSGELNLPVTHVGVGERMEDLKPFDAGEFVRAILG